MNSELYILLLYILLFFIICIGILYGIWRLWRHLHIKNQEFYVCLDGHLVRSRGEWMIDAALQCLGIPHEYEPRVEINRQILHPDFRLKKGIYLEYWGLETRTYRKFKRMKENLFEHAKFKLISIENADLKNLLFSLDKKLRPLHMIDTKALSIK